MSVLRGVRILDFSWVLAGPYATRLLADFGAEVIKVQPHFPPAEEGPFATGYYQTWNRNKLGITLNLTKPEGITLAKKLVAISDAVVENYSSRVMANWGLDYDSLKKVRPDIIMLSMSIMGHTGPWRDYTGFGPTVHAFSGITHLTSFPGGPGYAYADHIAGLFGSLALLAALEHRAKTGEGQFIDLAQVETMTSLLGSTFLEHAMEGEVRPNANSSQIASPHGVYPCRGHNRWCAIAVSSEQEWQAFKLALGSPSWVDEARFATLAGRLENSEELDRQVSAWTSSLTAAEVVARLQNAGVSAGLVQDARDLAKSPHLRTRGFFVELPHPESGVTVSDASPIKLSRTPADYRRAAPLPGQDNDYVYGGLLGLNKREIASLKCDGVI